MATLAAMDLTGDTRDALTRLLEPSGSVVAESAALPAAAQDVLPPGRIRELHAAPAARGEDLIRRGQDPGVFRTDMPLGRLVGLIQNVLHRAAEEIRAASRLVTSTGRSVVVGR